MGIVCVGSGRLTKDTLECCRNSLVDLGWAFLDTVAQMGWRIQPGPAKNQEAAMAAYGQVSNTEDLCLWAYWPTVFYKRNALGCEGSWLYFDFTGYFFFWGQDIHKHTEIKTKADKNQ